MTLVRQLAPPAKPFRPWQLRLPVMFDPRAVAHFTPRELQVLEFVGLGMTNAEIALVLRISARTVHMHRTNIRRKLGVRTNAALLRHAMLVAQEKLSRHIDDG